MDAMRKQLDQLMGANRNGDVRVVSRKYYDHDVCRPYLAGLCPHDLFQYTKMDMGPCRKLHSLQLRKEYEEAKANYDHELEETIERLVVDCERKIQRTLKRMDNEDSKAAIAISVTEVTRTKEVMELSKQIWQKMKDIDAFDLEGNTEGKIQATEELDKLKEQRAHEQAMILLEAFTKERASLISCLQNVTQTTKPVPPAALDACTQEMINEKLKKAEELGENGMVDEAKKLLDESEALKKVGAPYAWTQEMISENLKKAEELGENGMVDEAQKLLDESEALKKLSTGSQTVPDSTNMKAPVKILDQKLRLCDICGAFMSLYDGGCRLASHFGGKFHMDYMLLRERLSELQKNKKLKLEQAEYDRRSRERSAERARASSRDRYRGDRSSSRDRDYDRRRSHDRNHDRDREKDYRQSRSYDSRSHRRVTFTKGKF